MDATFTRMFKMDLTETIDQIIRAFRETEGEEFLILCSQFIYELVLIEKYFLMSDEDKQTEYRKVFDANSDTKDMEERQIKLCVMTRLRSEELLKLKYGILNFKAIGAGYEDYTERFDLCRVNAKRIVEMLNIGKGTHSPEYKIAMEFSEKLKQIIALPSIGTGVIGCLDILMTLTKDKVESIVGYLTEADDKLSNLYAEA